MKCGENFDGDGAHCYSGSKYYCCPTNNCAPGTGPGHGRGGGKSISEALAYIMKHPNRVQEVEGEELK